MATLCRERAAELAAMPLFQTTALITDGVVFNKFVTRALAARESSAAGDALATLRHLLAFPSLRDVAIKASRLKSLANLAIQTASRADVPSPAPTLPRRQFCGCCRRQASTSFRQGRSRRMARR
jgi:hypothetical protein